MGVLEIADEEGRKYSAEVAEQGAGHKAGAPHVHKAMAVIKHIASLELAPHLLLESIALKRLLVRYATKQPKLRICRSSARVSK